MSTDEGSTLVAQRALPDGCTQGLYKIGDGYLIITINPRDLCLSLSKYPLHQKDVDAFRAECGQK